MKAFGITTMVSVLDCKYLHVLQIHLQLRRTENVGALCKWFAWTSKVQHLYATCIIMLT